MNLPFVIRWTLACAVLLAARPDPARAEPVKTPPVNGGDARHQPSLRELWVPAETSRLFSGIIPGPFP